jgi:hypothetical protein
MSSTTNQDPARRRRLLPRTLPRMALLVGTLVVIAAITAVAAIAASGGRPALGTITGVVVTGPLIPVDPGSPVGWTPTQADVLVFKSGTDTLVSSAHSNADGAFTLKVAAGSYRLAARLAGAGARPSPVPVTLTIVAGEPTKVRLWLDTGVRVPANQGIACTPPARSGGSGSPDTTDGQNGHPASFSQGVSGSVRIGPLKPVSTPGQSNTKPYAARLSIYRLNGAAAATVTSDASGAFSVGLPAGAYIVEPGARGPLFPRAHPFSITIQKEQWRCVTIVYDTGIR